MFNMSWTKVLYRLLIVGLMIYHWVMFQRSQTIEELVEHGFEMVFWLCCILLIAVFQIKHPDQEKAEKVEAEEVEEGE